MIARIVTWAVEKRWLVVLLTAIAAIIGATALSRLPIDAVPDITNNQIQINVRAPALSDDSTDIYFARQQVGERLNEATENIPDGVRPEMGPIATGLGDVYMWTVRLAPRKDDAHKAGEPGLQPDGSHVTPEGERLATHAAQAAH